jgi:hypothetical protein
VNEVPVFGLFDLEVAFARAAQIGLRDLVTGNGNLYLLDLGIDLAARQIDEYPVDALSREFLGCADGCQHGVLCRIHIDDAAVANTRRSLLGDTDDTDTAFGIGMGDEAACLGAADVERGNDSCTKLGHGQTAFRLVICGAR